MVSSGFSNIIDISQPEAVEIGHLYTCPYDLEELDYTFSHYDKNTGDAVFINSESSGYVSFYTFKDKELTELNGSGKVFQQSYVFRWPNVYEVIINNNNDLELVYRTSFPLLEKVEHTCRDLAGTSYIDKTGIFRESLVFRTFGVVQLNDIEPVQDIFPIGNDCVLVSGSSSCAVVRIRTGDLIDTWRKTEATIFASEHFQVTKSKVYTKNGEMELLDANMLAVFGTKLVVGSSSKVLIISDTPEVEKEIGDACICSVFDGGYLTATDVKFFDELKEDLPSGGAVDVAVIGSKVYTQTLKFELIEAISKQKIDLDLETVNFVYDCGCGVIIVGSNDSFLYTNGEFFSLRNIEEEKMIIDNSKNQAIALENGVVYMKSNIGYHMVKKSVNGFQDYEKITVYKDKVLFHRLCENERVRLFVRPIKGGLVRSFTLPPQSRNGAFYFMLSDEMVMELYDCKIYEIDLNRSTRTYTDIELNDESMVVLSPDGEKLYVTWCDGQAAKVYGIEDGIFQLLSTHYAGEVDYTFGFRATDYPKSGDHWLTVMFSGFSDRSWSSKLNTYFLLTPKTERNVDFCYYVDMPVDSCMGATMNALASSEKLVDEVACVQSDNEPQTYFAAHLHGYGSGVEITKLHPGRRQEIYAMIRVKSQTVKYTNMHGRKVKYEPEFIAASGDTLTITILSPEEAEKLKAVQKELAIKWCHEEKFEIDGKLLLTFSNDPVNDKVFIKHGTDPKQLKKDFLDVFK